MQLIQLTFPPRRDTPHPTLRPTSPPLEGTAGSPGGPKKGGSRTRFPLEPLPPLSLYVCLPPPNSLPRPDFAGHRGQIRHLLRRIPGSPGWICRYRPSLSRWCAVPLRLGWAGGAWLHCGPGRLFIRGMSMLHRTPAPAAPCPAQTRRSAAMAGRLP
jgi:hypothetical protein